MRTNADIVRSYIEKLSEHRPSDTQEAIALTALEKLRADSTSLKQVKIIISQLAIFLSQ